MRSGPKATGALSPRAPQIIARSTLEAWAAAYPDRLQLVHTLTREPLESNWQGRRGRIDETFLRAHVPPPSADVLIFVCGPPAMYNTLSGARTEKKLSGALAGMGYRANQVVKF